MADGRPYVVYHHPCFDGFTAAWAVYKRLGREGADYVPYAWGTAWPEFEPGRTVYFVDMCPIPDMIIKYAKTNPVVVLDHHKSSLDNFNKTFYDGKTRLGEFWEYKHPDGYSVVALFDMERSGAAITWDYFSEDEAQMEARSRLVQYVQDRDLWQFKLENTNEIHAFMGLFPWTFLAWDEIDTTLRQNFDLAVDYGKVAVQARKRVIEELLNGKRCFNVGGYLVPAVNSPKQFGSDVANELLAKYPDAKFAVYYWDRGDGRREWGLRSNGFDVAEIAKKYGGGGHQKAAGFTTSYTDDLDLKSRQGPDGQLGGKLF